MLKRLKTQQGMGLIETLVTLLIIAGSVIALIRFQNNLAYQNSLIQQQNTALNLASTKIASLQTFTTLTGGSNSYQSIASGSSSSTINDATYTVTWTVTDNTTYKTVNVTVSWQDHYGVSQSKQLTTNIAKVDPASSASIM